MAFFNACLRPADSSVLLHPSKSITTLFRGRFFKKSSSLPKSQSRIYRPTQKQQSNRRFQRIKGSNVIRKVSCEMNQTMDSTSNYDMTVFHNDTQVAVAHREFEKIPRWARESELHLAMINQIYDKNPDEIFGSVYLDGVLEMVESLELWNTEVPMFFSYDNFPRNFV